MKFLRKELNFIQAVFLFRAFLLYIKMDISFTSDQESRPFILYLCFKLTYISAHFRWEIMQIFTKEQLRKAVHSFKHDLLFFFIYKDGLKSQELKESWLLGQMCAYNRGQSVSTLDGDI